MSICNVMHIIYWCAHGWQEYRLGQGKVKSPICFLIFNDCTFCLVHIISHKIIRGYSQSRGEVARDHMSFTWVINQDIHKLCVKRLLAPAYIMGMDQMKFCIPRGQRNASVREHDLWMVLELSVSETHSGRWENWGSRGWVIELRRTGKQRPLESCIQIIHLSWCPFRTSDF